MALITTKETAPYRIRLTVTLSDSTHGEINAFELITAARQLVRALDLHAPLCDGSSHGDEIMAQHGIGEPHAGVLLRRTATHGLPRQAGIRHFRSDGSPRLVLFETALPPCACAATALPDLVPLGFISLVRTGAAAASAPATLPRPNVMNFL